MALPSNPFGNARDPTLAALLSSNVGLELIRFKEAISRYELVCESLWISLGELAQLAPAWRSRSVMCACKFGPQVRLRVKRAVVRVQRTLCQLRQERRYHHQEILEVVPSLQLIHDRILSSADDGAALRLDRFVQCTRHVLPEQKFCFHCLTRTFLSEFDTSTSYGCTYNFSWVFPFQSCDSHQTFLILAKLALRAIPRRVIVLNSFCPQHLLLHQTILKAKFLFRKF